MSIVEPPLPYGNIRVIDWVVPGSHNAGTYTLRRRIAPDAERRIRDIINKAFIGSGLVYNIIESWSRTQSGDIYAQLSKGSRYLDVRLALDNDGRFYCVHGIYGADFEAVLYQIRYFLRDNPLAIIHLDVHKFFSLKHDSHGKIVDLMKKLLGNYALPHDNDDILQTLTFHDMWSSDKRLIIYYNNDDACRHDNRLWPREPRVMSWWANARTIDQLVPAIESYAVSALSSSQLFVMQSIITVNSADIKAGVLRRRNSPSSLRTLCKTFNPKILRHIQSASMWKGRLNVILCDFVTDYPFADVCFHLSMQRNVREHIHRALEFKQYRVIKTNKINSTSPSPSRSTSAHADNESEDELDDDRRQQSRSRSASRVKKSGTPHGTIESAIESELDDPEDSRTIENDLDALVVDDGDKTHDEMAHATITQSSLLSPGVRDSTPSSSPNISDVSPDTAMNSLDVISESLSSSLSDDGDGVHSPDVRVEAVPSQPVSSGVMVTGALGPSTVLTWTNKVMTLFERPRLVNICSSSGGWLRIDSNGQLKCDGLHAGYGALFAVFLIDGTSTRASTIKIRLMTADTRFDICDDGRYVVAKPFTGDNSAEHTLYLLNNGTVLMCRRDGDDRMWCRNIASDTIAVIKIRPVVDADHDNAAFIFTFVD